LFFVGKVGWEGRVLALWVPRAKARRSLPKGLLLFFLQLDYDYFDWFVAGVDVGVHGVGRVGGEPVGFACLPDVGFFCAALIDDVHRAALKRDDYTAMVMPVHGERRVGEDEGAPDFDFVILKELSSLGLGLGLGTNGCEEGQHECASRHCAVQGDFHEASGVAEV
jgi:hypothetical protein